MKIKCILFALSFVAVLQTTTAQNVGINSTGAAPDNSAMLDIVATNKGLLIPRVSLSSTTDNVTVPTPTTSLLIYNTNASITNGNGEGYYYNSGTPTAPNWVKLVTSNAKPWETAGNAGTIASTNFLGTTDAVDLVLRTDNTEKMRIMSGGNVGIGTSSPNYKLDITPNATTGTGIRVSDNGTNAGVQLITVGDDTYLTDLDVVNRLGIYGQQNSDVGSIQLGSGGGYLYGANSNIGVGTTSPASKLEVNAGSIRISGSTNTNAETGGMLIYNNSSGLGGGTARKVERLTLVSNVRTGNTTIYNDQFITLRIFGGTSAFIQLSTKNGYDGTYSYNTLDDGAGGSTVNAATVGTFYTISTDFRFNHEAVEWIVTRRANTDQAVYKITVFKHSVNLTSEQAYVIVEAYYP
jgi:hypothetical protein